MRNYATTLPAILGGGLFGAVAMYAILQLPPEYALVIATLLGAAGAFAITERQ